MIVKKFHDGFVKIRRIKVLLIALTCLMIIPGSFKAEAQTPMPNSNGQNQTMSTQERMQWWHEAKFGMFIHWGLYAVPAGEWKGQTNHAEWIMLTGNILSAEYEKFAGQFNPVKFDAKQWVQIAKDAGMKYIVITSKHHDGFSMYDSKLTNYDIIDATQFGRDPMKELAQACGEVGLKFCFYYSVVDWHHPEFPAKYSQRGFHGNPNPNADLEKYVAYMQGQVRELLSNYGPIGIMWFDGGGSFQNAPMAELIHAQETIDLIRKLQPACIINNRLRLPADYGTPEQRIPGLAPETAFEVCMTLNRHWGYNKNDNDWKSPETIIHNLADIAGKGGNYLLNVGPTAEGLIPEGSINTLREVGKWMKKYGDSIYGTTASPFEKLDWGRCTAKDGKLFLHVFDWPADGKLRVPDLKNKVIKAYLLTEDSTNKLDFERENADNLVINVPADAPDKIDSVVVLEIEGKPEVLPFRIAQANNDSVLLKAVDAVIHGQIARYESGDGKDDIGYWTDPKDYVEWSFRINTPGKFEIEITYACSSGSGGSEYQISVGGNGLNGKIHETGSWTEFATDNVGQVDISKAGDYTLTVKPKNMPGYAVMNLQSVRLVLAK
jgi:alpha-L-fucosidase